MRKKLFGVLAALMLTVSTMQVAAAEVPATENLNYTYENIDGGEISTQSSGKPKILVFFKTTCGYCRSTLRDIASSEWLKNGEADVCAIEINFATVDDVKAFRDQYCSGSSIMFASTAEDYSLVNSVWSYMSKLDMGNSLTTPLVVMINSDNEIRGVSTGRLYSTEIEEYLPILNSNTDDTTDPDDTQKPGDTTDPDDTQKPGDSTDPDDTQKPGDTTDPDDTQKPGDSTDPDDTQKPDDTTDPDDTQKPGDTTDPDGTQKPGDTTDPDDTQKPGDTTSPDDTQKPDDIQDSASANKPSKPDTSDSSDDSDESENLLRAAEEMEKIYKNSPAVKYAEYLKDMAASLRNTKQNEFVINTNTWTCFNRTMMDAIKSRPDVTVTVNYIYDGKPCVLVIPAGTDVSQFMDQNGFAGFRYIEKMLNEKK